MGKGNYIVKKNRKDTTSEYRKELIGEKKLHAKEGTAIMDQEGIPGKKFSHFGEESR